MSTETETSKVRPELSVHPRWICQVVRSGYHNGAGCRPSEPHAEWGCGYRYELSLPATPEVAEMLKRAGIEVIGEDQT